MKVRPIVLSAVVALSAVLSMSAKAHDPAEFDRMMSAPASKAVPATCVQLADTLNYSNDMSNVGIKALQARCDVATKAAAKKAAAKKATAKKAAARAAARKAAAHGVAGATK